MENTSTKNLLISFGSVILAFLCWVIPDQLAVRLADLLVEGKAKYYWLTVHHLVQLTLVIGIMLLPWWGKTLSDWGWNFKNKEETLKILKAFAIGWLIFSTIFVVITNWVAGWPETLGFQATKQNVVWYLFFELIIVGFAEEAMFRGLVYGVLKSNISIMVDLKLFQVSVAGILSAVIFTLAHVGFDFSQFKVTTVDPMQLIVAFVLGIFYVILRERTGSLLGPIIAHNLTDGSLTIVYLMIHFFKVR